MRWTDGTCLRESGPWVYLEFTGELESVGWSIVGGGLGRARRVVWRSVTSEDLREDVDPEAWIVEQLEGSGHMGIEGDCPVALLTSRSLDAMVWEEVEVEGVVARCVATVGLGNALRAGDPIGGRARISTINLAVWVNRRLEVGARLEALSLVTAARCAALESCGVPSAMGTGVATGTGTDCNVLLSAVEGESLAYAGMHTAVGSAVGKATFLAVRCGAEGWLAEHPDVERVGPWGRPR